MGRQSVLIVARKAPKQKWSAAHLVGFSANLNVLASRRLWG
jgi:hypothetical protein